MRCDGLQTSWDTVHWAVSVVSCQNKGRLRNIDLCGVFVPILFNAIGNREEQIVDRFEALLELCGIKREP